MTMSFLLHDALGETESIEPAASPYVNARIQRDLAALPVSLIEEKFYIPEYAQMLDRERLFELLERSVKLYGATLISGRAGTGKTVLAAGFARRQLTASWYSIEPADCDWGEFLSSFVASLFGPSKATFKLTSDVPPDEAAQADLLSSCFKKLGQRRFMGPRLIVLDNIHHLFDAFWFAGFFRQLVLSLDKNVRLLMLCRSKPSAPLWRMRSKQMLNVIDESLLYFSESETKEFCRVNGLPENLAVDAHRRSFGRAASLTKLMDEHIERS